MAVILGGVLAAGAEPVTDSRQVTFTATPSVRVDGGGGGGQMIFAAEPNVRSTGGGGGGGFAAVDGPRYLDRRFVYRDGDTNGAETVWLGVGVEEVSKPLAAQLALKPGEGLVVTYVATNSPAAAAGLQENDVLVELDGQMLVDNTQLRKLVQMHADGDSAKIKFYRAGKKESASAKLEKKTLTAGMLGTESSPDDVRFFYLKKALDADQGRIKVEMKQAMENAQLAVQDALQQARNANVAASNQNLDIIFEKLGKLASGGMKLSRDATVVVKNDGATVRTIVKKDDTGIYVVVADPTKQLTAHDAAGKLLFDGPIETSEQQEKVPQEVWSKVSPMLTELTQDPPPPPAPVAPPEPPAPPAPPAGR